MEQLNGPKPWRLNVCKQGNTGQGRAVYLHSPFHTEDKHKIKTHKISKQTHNQKGKTNYGAEDKTPN